MKSERPRFADGIVTTIGDGEFTQPEILDTKYCSMRHFTESQLRMLFVEMVSLGILDEIRYSDKVITYKVSKKEKERCLNLAKKVNKGCKEWMKGLPELWNGQFRSPRSILQSSKG